MNFKQKLIYILIGCLLIILTGCAWTTGEKIKYLNIDMPRSEVINRLGRPDGVRVSGEYEALKYAHRYVSGWGHDRADYNVILKNGRVVEYGIGEVRVKPGPLPVLIIVPFPR